MELEEIDFDSEYLRSSRLKKGLSQEQLAGKMNRNVETIEYLESKKSYPTMFTLYQLSKFFKVPMEKFIKVSKNG